MKKIIFAIVLFAASWAANAVTLVLVSHLQTSGNGTSSTLITDGSHISGAVSASTASWDWDGTTLSATGLYTATSSIGSSQFSASILSDSITNLSIDTSTVTGSAMAYACVEGTFLSSVGASGCGDYDFGSNFTDESTTIWGPGTDVSRTLGGDDEQLIGGSGPRNISAYDFGLVSTTGAGMYLGDTVVIGNGIAIGTYFGEEMTFQVVPVPAAVWLFGSALGLLGWLKRKGA